MSHTSYSKMDSHGRPVPPVKPVPKDGQKIKQIQGKLEGVKSTMHSNITAALAREDQLHDLEDQTAHLQESGEAFRKTAGDVKKHFQWKALLWQLAFAGIILLILSAVTLYILSATGVLSNSGRSTPPAVVPLATAPPTERAIAETPSTPAETEPSATPDEPSSADDTPSTPAALFVTKDISLAHNRLFAEGESCKLGISAVTACATGLRCMPRADSTTEGVCRTVEPPINPDTLVNSQPTGTGSDKGCAEGEVACTEELVAQGNSCIIGRCIIQATVANKPQTATDNSQEQKDNTSQKQTDKASVEPSKPSAPPKGSFDAKGEDPAKTEEEIREALVTLHRHGADCAVGILHKDCTLELMMQTWGVNN